MSYVKNNKIIYYLGIGRVIISVFLLYFLKFFNLSWVEANTNYAKVTINFLFPMNQEELHKHLYLEGLEKGQDSFKYTLAWIKPQVAELKFKEYNTVNGQKVKLVIRNAPTKYKALSKSLSIPVQFKADIRLLEPNGISIISSQQSFAVRFNTPIAIHQIQRAMACEEVFEINSSHKSKSQFILTPKKRLENGKQYDITFKKGMRALCGTTLQQDQKIVVQVDEKPSIIKTYPSDGDQWIGLYPLIQLESKDKIILASATLDGEPLKKVMVDEKHACFLLNKILQPETHYHLAFQIQAQSGEASDVKEVLFTTTSVAQKRFWIDIHTDEPKRIVCYEGSEAIRTLYYESSKKVEDRQLGTYYLQGKSENYDDPKHHLGGNYWFIISDQLGIQGTLRDDFWQPIQDYSHTSNMIITDEEASWLYDKMKEETMIIVRR